jgi:glycosyltransferase involved in cell wall biosynthesis
MNNVSISVVIPVYNRKDELFRAINSVLIQTLQAIEIIVVDDCSDINVSEALALEFGDTIIRVISNSVNMGAAKSRNLGVKAAHGDFIAFLDSDDYWYESKLARQAEMFLRDIELDLVYTDQLLDRGDILSPSGKELINEHLTSKLISGWTAPNTSTLMFKKSSFLKVKGFNENLKSCQDHDLWFKFAQQAMKINYVNSPLSVFVLESSNRISYNLEKRMEGVIEFLGIWKSYIIDESSTQCFLDFRSEYFYKTSFPIFVNAIKYKNVNKALFIYFRYLCLNRFFYKHVFAQLIKSIKAK